MTARKCAFVQSRVCPIEVDEVPLDVCRLCVEAWKTSAEIHKITGANVLGPTIMVPAGQQPLPAIVTPPGTPSLESPVQTPLTFAPKIDKEPPLTFTPNINEENRLKENKELLAKLDNDFIMDRISAEEYVERRRELVNQIVAQKADKPSLLSKAIQEGYLTIEDALPTGPPENYFKVTVLDDEPIDDEYPGLPVILMEKREDGKIELTKINEEWSIPAHLNEENLQKIYALYEEEEDITEKLLVELRGLKIGIIGRYNSKLIGIVLREKDTIEDHQEEINKLIEILEIKNNIDDFVKTVKNNGQKEKDLSID